MTTRNVLDCRAKLKGCMGLVTFDDSELVNGRVDDWVEVRRRVNGLPWDYDGVCPACIAAAKPTSAKPKAVRPAAVAVRDRQQSLFGGDDE